MPDLIIKRRNKLQKIYASLFAEILIESHAFISIIDELYSQISCIKVLLKLIFQKFKDNKRNFD
jgi:hypothetical protein